MDIAAGQRRTRSECQLDNLERTSTRLRSPASRNFCRRDEFATEAQKAQGREVLAFFLRPVSGNQKEKLFSVNSVPL
jgi:hypothetical protein